jgi:SAM-dependent methyltransferase
MSIQRKSERSTQHRRLDRRARLAVLARLRRQPAQHPFDKAHGVDTGGFLLPAALTSGHAHDAQTTVYYGTQPSVFRSAMRSWTAEIERRSEALADFTLVDVGCGKGRVLMLASEYPLRRIAGVELSPQMAAAARANLALWGQRPRACEQIDVIEGDALAFALPHGPVLLYLYHPFEEELFARWAASLMPQLAQRTAPVYLLYMNPYCEHALQVIPEARFLWSERLPFSADEAAARLLDDTDELVSLYRLTAEA